jgi:hypothetical protein
VEVEDKVYKDLELEELEVTELHFQAEQALSIGTGTTSTPSNSWSRW